MIRPYSNVGFSFAYSIYNIMKNNNIIQEELNRTRQLMGFNPALTLNEQGQMGWDCEPQPGSTPPCQCVPAILTQGQYQTQQDCMMDQGNCCHQGLPQWWCIGGVAGMSCIQSPNQPGPNASGPFNSQQDCMQSPNCGQGGYDWYCTVNPCQIPPCPTQCQAVPQGSQPPANTVSGPYPDIMHCQNLCQIQPPLPTWKCKNKGSHPKFGKKCVQLQPGQGDFITKQECVDSGCQGIGPGDGGETPDFNTGPTTPPTIPTVQSKKSDPAIPIWPSKGVIPLNEQSTGTTGGGIPLCMGITAQGCPGTPSANVTMTTPTTKCATIDNIPVTANDQGRDIMAPMGGPHMTVQSVFPNVTGNGSANVTSAQGPCPRPSGPVGPTGCNKSCQQLASTFKKKAHGKGCNWLNNRLNAFLQKLPTTTPGSCKGKRISCKIRVVKALIQQQGC